MKGAVAFLIIVAAGAYANAQARPGAAYIGYKYKGVVPGSTLSNGVKHLGGGLIGDINANPVYGISMVSRGKTKMLWLEVSTGQDSGGVTGWRVLDVLSFYSQRVNDHLLFGADPAIECRRNGNPIEHLVGIGRIVRREGVFRPSSLWVASLKARRFVPVSGAGVKCTYSEP